MQLTIPGVHHEWISYFYRTLADLVAIGVIIATYKRFFAQIVVRIKERNKPAAEVREINANTELKLVKAQIDASEMLRHQNQNLMEANEYALTLTSEVAQLRRDIDMVRVEKRLLYAQVEQCKEVFRKHPELRIELDKLIKISGG